MRLEGLTMPPPPPAVGLAQAKAALRIPATETSEDGRVSQWICEATERIEAHTGRAIHIREIVATWSDVRTGDVLSLPRPPLVTVDKVEVQGADKSWTEIFSTTEPFGYLIDSSGVPATIQILDGLEGINASQPGHFRVTYQAGYPLDKIPALLTGAVLHAVGSAYSCGSSAPEAAGQMMEGALAMVRSLVVPNVHFAEVA